MKKSIRAFVVFVVVVVAVIGAAYGWHVSEMGELTRKMQDEQASKKLMEQRIDEICKELNSAESDKNSLLEQIDELLTEESVALDSEAIKEEILNIGELATVEYCFTNVGTIDSAEMLSFVEVKLPFSEKTAVVTMDGVIKAGVDVTKVEVTVNEVSKTVEVKLPDPEILSNELFEDTMEIYVEEDSIFNKLSLEDSSSLRADIKEKARQNAIESGILDRAHKQAGDIIRCLIEAAPNVKGTYQIIIT